MNWGQGVAGSGFLPFLAPYRPSTGRSPHFNPIAPASPTRGPFPPPARPIFSLFQQTAEPKPLVTQTLSHPGSVWDPSICTGRQSDARFARF
jgi:hypothetical protein